jgi:serine/threonine protein phosphatase PrpC
MIKMTLSRDRLRVISDRLKVIFDQSKTTFGKIISKSRRFIDYVIDTMYCRIYGAQKRLDKNDIITMIIWPSSFIITLVLSLMKHIGLAAIYGISFIILWSWSIVKKIRAEKQKSLSSYGQIEVINHQISDMDNISIVVGKWTGKRNHMEDEYFICPHHKLFGVFDGHGGNDASIWIKHLFSAQFDEIFNQSIFCSESVNNSDNKCTDIDQMILGAMEKTIIQMDNDICYYFSKSGAVGVCLKVHSDKIYCSYIGDSGACVLTHDDQIISLTRSHGMYDFDEYCRYRDTMGPIRPRRGAILRTHSGLMPTRTIGDMNHKDNDPGVINLPESQVFPSFGSGSGRLSGDFIPYDWKMILIGTDGIWDCFTPHQLIGLVKSHIIKSKLIHPHDNNNNNNNNNTNNNTNVLDLTDCMAQIHGITNKKPDLIDKLTGRYYGDNCTLMCLINKKAFM